LKDDGDDININYYLTVTAATENICSRIAVSTEREEKKCFLFLSWSIIAWKQ